MKASANGWMGMRENTFRIEGGCFEEREHEIRIKTKINRDSLVQIVEVSGRFARGGGLRATRAFNAIGIHADGRNQCRRKIAGSSRTQPRSSIAWPCPWPRKCLAAAASSDAFGSRGDE